MVIKLNNSILRYIRLIIFFLPVLDCYSQNLKFKTYLVEDGLSNNSINQLANDPEGGIWIGTWNGLNYFDGKSFKIYKHNPTKSNSLPGNYIYDLLVDGQGQLWVHADPYSISIFREENSFVSFIFNSKILNISLDSQQNVVISLESGFKKFNAQKEAFEECKDCNPLDTKRKVISTHINPKNELIWDQMIDRNGNMWVASKDKGLYFQPYFTGSDQLFEHYSSDLFNPYGLRSNEITCILEDSFGNIWLGLKDGGISRVIQQSESLVHIYPHPDSNAELPYESIRAIGEGADGTLWLGYYNSGVYYRMPGKRSFKKLKLPENLSSQDWHRIRSVHTDQSGDLWIGSYEGLLRVRQHQVIDSYTEDYNANFYKRVYAFAEDPERKQLWVASWKGVSLIDLKDGSLLPFAKQKSLERFNIRNIYFLSNTLYLCTEKDGLILLKNGEMSAFDKSNGLLDNSVYDIFHTEKSGKTWIATHSGVTVWDSESGEIYYLTEKDGLLSA